MRIRATVAAVSGALALSAFVVPAAQAAGSAPSYRADAVQALHASGRTAFSTAEGADLGVTFSNLKIASAVRVGTTNHVSTTVTYTLTHGANYSLSSSDFANGPFLYKGSSPGTASNVLFGDNPATCTATSATTAACKGAIDIRPADGELLNSQAGTWHAGGLALQYSTGDSSVQGGLGTTYVQRYSKLTTTVSSTSVYKGRSVTVSGRLTRADWEKHTYNAVGGQSVKLQFRKSGTSTYTTVKTVTTDSSGNAKTTATVNSSGYWRYSYAGISTTPAVSATGVYVAAK
ncbi:hypothetical protein [Streptomyces sp. NPDC001153]